MGGKTGRAHEEGLAAADGFMALSTRGGVLVKRRSPEKGAEWWGPVTALRSGISAAGLYGTAVTVLPPTN